jgi:HEAT repeat protein
MATPPSVAAMLLQQLVLSLARGKEQATVSEGLERLLDEVDLRSLPGVDEALRARSYWFDDTWKAVSPKDATSSWWRRVPWPVAAVASSHPSGFVREAAVRTLGGSANGKVIRFLVLRLNDWVPEVQWAARASLATFMAVEYAPSLIESLPLLSTLERQRRADHGPVRSWVFTLLRSESCHEAIRDGFSSPNREVRGACYQIASDPPNPDSANALDTALHDRDPQLRVWAVREVGKSAAEPFKVELLRQAIRDRSVQVRRAALAAMLPILPNDEARILVEAALLDENATARWQARLFRLQLGPFDLPAFYRQALTSASTASRLRGALQGLGESGDRQDIARALPFCSSDSPRVIGAAVEALSDLEDVATVRPFVAALESSHAAVSRAGLRALVARIGGVSSGWLSDLINAETRPIHVRLNALRLASHMTKWDRLPLIVEGCGTASAAVSARAGLLLNGWHARYNQSFRLPSEEQLGRADSALERVEGRIQPRAVANLRDILRNLR